MKNSFIYFLVSVNLIFFLSCAENERNESVTIDPSNGNTYPLTVKDEFGFAWPRNLVVDNIIYLPTKEDLLIVPLSKLMISPLQDRYYIFDDRQSKIFGFDEQGNNISIFSKRGSGPGEYREIKDVQIDFESNQIEILDQYQIKKFNLIDFEYLGSVSLQGIKGNNIYGNFVNIEGVYYLFTSLPPAHRMIPSARINTHEFHLLRKEGDKLDFFIPKEYGVMGMKGDPRFRQSHVQGEYNLTPILGRNEIIGINKEGIFTKFHFPFAKNGVTEVELRNIHDREGEFMGTNYYKFLNNIMETERHLLFNFLGSSVQYHVLFDKETKKVISIGRSKEYMPSMISSDSKYFYCYILPASLLNYIKEGNTIENHPILKSIDLDKLAKDNNPVVIQFHLD